MFNNVQRLLEKLINILIPFFLSYFVGRLSVNLCHANTIFSCVCLSICLSICPSIIKTPNSFKSSTFNLQPSTFIFYPSSFISRLLNVSAWLPTLTLLGDQREMFLHSYTALVLIHFAISKKYVLHLPVRTSFQLREVESFPFTLLLIIQVQEEDNFVAPILLLWFAFDTLVW